MTNSNSIIKQYAKQRGVYLWELAQRFGITDTHFSRKLRKEFSLEDRALAMRYIDEIAQEKKEEAVG